MNESEILTWLVGKTITDAIRIVDQDSDQLLIVVGGPAVEIVARWYPDSKEGLPLTLRHVRDFEGELAAIEIVAE